MTATGLLTHAQMPAGRWHGSGLNTTAHGKPWAVFLRRALAVQARTLSCSSGNSNEIEYPSHQGKGNREDRDKHGQCLPFDDLAQYQHLGQ